MRADRLRAIFNSKTVQDSITPQPPHSQELVEDLLKDDLVKITSTVIGVQHFETLSGIYSVKYPDTFADKLPILKYNSYDKLYNILQDVSYDKLLEREFSFHSDELTLIEYSLSSMISLFESVEEYHKCARLKRILDTIQTRQTLSH